MQASSSSTESTFAQRMHHTTGIPESWFRRPKLPSRNWLIFLGTVSSLTYIYYDDRKKCRLIKEDYINKVKHLAEQPLQNARDETRRVRVYACRWPGDHEHDTSLKFFKKYVKPILVAAAVDYVALNGNHYGGISDAVAEHARVRRLQILGVQPPTSASTTSTLAAQAAHDDIGGGIVLIGRHTFKEYLHGLRNGWTENLSELGEDKDERLSRLLENDPVFDELDILGETHASTLEPSAEQDAPESSSPGPSLLRGPPVSSPSWSPPYSSHRALPPNRPQSTEAQKKLQLADAQPAHLHGAYPEATIPAQPPLLLVDYPHLQGFRDLPRVIIGFFNHSAQVRIGCEAAYRLVMNHTRAFIEPEPESIEQLDLSSHPGDSSSKRENSDGPFIPTAGLRSTGDVDFERARESHFGKEFVKIPTTISKKRREYYEKELPPMLKTARELSRGERQPTSDEEKYPPKTENELRQSRQDKERRWRSDEATWVWMRREVGAVWDTRFQGALRVFCDPPEL